MYAWDNEAVWFLDDRWAYWGFPPSGRPTCTAETTALDEDGRPTEHGCRRWSHDPRSGTVTVGSVRGTLRGDDDLDFGEREMNELTVPRAGARFDLELEHQGFSGMCGLVIGCTTWQHHLLLSRDGKFVKSDSTTSTMGGVGTPYVWAGSFPPDETGTYEVLSNARIRFRFLDGSVETLTIGIQRDDAGRDSPTGEGVVVGETNYYPPV